MRVDGKQEAPRQAMSWLHRWISLLLGWLLYAIFLTGTLSFFQNEITVWMKPELHQSLDQQSRQVQLNHAVHALQQYAPNAEKWTIQFPSVREPVTIINFQNQGERPRRDGKSNQLFLDATTGERIQPRETAGGAFLYMFHFQLYGLPTVWGRTIVGIATMFMFVAIISGIITHRKIFKDFFTFRPNKGQRSWLDAHNATAVFALPFHLMITFSGFLLLIYTLMPFAIKEVYPDGRGAFFQALDTQQNATTVMSGGHRHHHGPMSGHSIPTSHAHNTVVKMADLGEMLHFAQHYWTHNEVASMTIYDPNSEKAKVEIIAQHSENFFKADGLPVLRFNAVTGQRLPTQESKILFTPAIYNLISILHLGRNTDIVLRWLLFLSGVLGTLMIATGLILWSVKRQQNTQNMHIQPFGHRLVNALNVATIIGLPIACAAYFYANRWIPALSPDRVAMEINVFFSIWLATFIHALIRGRTQAWHEQLACAAVLFLLLPIVNALTGGHGLWSSIRHAQWMIASFDLMCLFFAMIFFYAFYRIKQHQPREKNAHFKEEQPS